jgi:hypothetical protein
MQGLRHYNLLKVLTTVRLQKRIVVFMYEKMT